ncbi:hypothetical protein Bsph_3360 [Lysinibacillus sphaericus C3-41]|uniref:Uncharacterized protein n=1 Tax=Lysinibacillus sphaericus (strain C3-41) TaxID=444177 RepID=B1HR74_LYSSC|nr:hypothetical protein [Lysinibacillus sphaericus]ACA40854.1 hypothetical protein Bsph_3360 [Lysinibacillus sphaericus C3-41]
MWEIYVNNFHSVILQEDDFTLVTITPPSAENVQEDDTVDDTPEVIEATGQNTSEPEA